MMLTDPETGIGEEDFERLCEWVREHRRIVGRAFVAKLVAFPRRNEWPSQRLRKQGLSLNAMDTEIRRRFGRRREGGRRPGILRSKRAVLVGLDGKCVRGARMCKFLELRGGSVRLAGSAWLIARRCRGRHQGGRPCGPQATEGREAAPGSGREESQGVQD